ncbi:MAG: hypothetical protein UW30_C0004G0018 [Candidatus Giovannonibacteria bacterium GW2011_GWA2_44_13b]|uniref:Uncharacterized protein n=1 Tax=Candidatus Giovannonibacteria bacterium GW2011_GWA2_44_13b TaxID=1618647 RepID=A0A0G1K1Y1_9BACT|nr:MAG: hypothetical protein UW30_C0004G0018 [Candidatus Giovannonibacteria bacterium GW2011_GWA2_44_13b]
MAKLDNKKASDDNLDDDVEPAADVLDGDLEDEDEEENLDTWELEEDLE